MKPWHFYALLALAFTSCRSNSSSSSFLLDQVSNSHFTNIRLGDGVPLALTMSVRWHINDKEVFTANYGTPKRFDSLIFLPRQQELVGQVSNSFPNVDDVFGNERQAYIDAVKMRLQEQLVEEGLEIKEVVLSEIVFPTEYTAAKEQLGMQYQKLALIDNEKKLTIENAKAKEERAKAEGSVRIAEAKMAGDVSKITAETEKHRRLQSLAQAQTEAEVSKLRAQADAAKNIIMASAEADRIQKLNVVELEKSRKIKEQEILKVKELNALALSKEKDQALLCANNPKYASFLISKELASKVQIAVLPSEDGGIFNSMLQQQMVGLKGE